MKKDLPIGVWIKIGLFSLVVVLLGIAPWPHELIRSMSEPDHADDYVLIAKMQPWREGMWEMAGLQAFTDGEPLRAIQLLTHARNLVGLSDEGLMALGDAYYQAGDDMHAVQVWSQAASDRHIQPAYLHLSDYYHLHQEYASAAAVLEDYYRFQSTRGGIPADRLFELGLLLTAVDPQSGLVYLDQAAEMSPEYAIVSENIYREVERALREEQPAYTYVTAGRVLGRFGYWDLAKFALQQAVELRPDYAEAWAYLGEAVHQNGDDSGFQQISNALTLNPESLAANTYMAVFYQRIGDYETSIDYLEQAAQSDPNNLDLQIDLAAAIAASGDLDTALELYLQAVDRSSGRSAIPVGELIQFCVEYKVQVNELALPLAREAIASYPSQPGPFDWHGLVLYTLGDLRNAERAYWRALEEDPNYAPAHLHLGVLYLTEAKNQLGRDHLGKAMELTDDPQVILVARRHLGLEP